MADSDKKMLSDIARLYYEEDRTQAEIAEIYGVSRPTVFRRLSEAKRTGIVKIFIDSYDDEMNDLERALFSKFNLKGLKVASVPVNDEALAVQITARMGAQYLSGFLHPNDRVGVSWGWTLNEMCGYFPQLPFSVDVVCQTTGSVDNAMTRGYANEIVGNLSRKLNATHAYTLPCPVMVDNSIISDILRHDIKVQNVLSYGKNCNKLFINIALPDTESCLYQAGYLGDSELDELKAKNTVGSICCRFFNEDGVVSDESIDNRTMGISIEEIRNADCVLACITGKKKARAVYAALKSGLIDVLVIDSLTASAVLNIATNQAQ